LHSSLNGGSLEQAGIDKLTAPAPPLDADMPLDAAPLLDVDTLRDPQPLVFGERILCNGPVTNSKHRRP